VLKTSCATGNAKVCTAVMWDQGKRPRNCKDKSLPRVEVWSTTEKVGRYHKMKNKVNKYLKLRVLKGGLSTSLGSELEGVAGRDQRMSVEWAVWMDGCVKTKVPERMIKGIL